jgi:hypothetical protein
MRYNSIVTRLKGGIPVDWSRIKAEYIAGGTSYRKLAKKYDVPFMTLADRAKAEKWVELKKQAQDKANTLVVDKIAQDQAECATIISDITVALLRQMAEDVAECRLTPVSASFYKEAADALRKYKDVVGVKSPKDAEEQEARILNLRRQVETESNKDQTIVVQFEGAEAYSE